MRKIGPNKRRTRTANRAGDVVGGVVVEAAVDARTANTAGEARSLEQADQGDDARASQTTTPWRANPASHADRASSVNRAVVAAGRERPRREPPRRHVDPKDDLDDGLEEIILDDDNDGDEMDLGIDGEEAGDRRPRHCRPVTRASLRGTRRSA